MVTSEGIFIDLCLSSDNSTVCPPGLDWSQCVSGPVFCSDVTMELHRNCTPGCQCPHGTLIQVCGGPHESLLHLMMQQCG